MKGNIPTGILMLIIIIFVSELLFSDTSDNVFYINGADNPFGKD